MADSFLTIGATTYDLTDPDTNPNAAPIATPQEAGFVLRNRIDFDEVTAPTCIASGVTTIRNVLKILEVPDGTVVRELRFHAIRGETAPTHAMSSTSTSSASGAFMNVGVTHYTSASHTSTVTDVDAVADHTITKATGACAGMPTLASNGELTDYVAQSDTSAPVLPFTFPYGGYLQMSIVGASTLASSAAIDGAFVGVLEVRAVCDYIPE